MNYLRRKEGVNIVLWVLLFSFLTGCMNDDVLHDFNRLHANRQGKAVFVVNEGNFMYGNASLSYYNPTTGKMLNNIFYNTNALPLGDVAYSMTIHDSLGYIVVNNSGKIYCINIHTFHYVGKITELTSPRYLLFITDKKAYVSDLYAKAITIVNPQNETITGTISLENNNPDFYQHPSEQMVAFDNKVFVNCWSYDNKVLVIDTQNDKIIDSITVGKQPNSMVIDKYQKLWVLSDGGSVGTPYGQEQASLTRIDAATLHVEKRFDFHEMAASPSNLNCNGSGDTLWYLYNNWAGGSVERAGVYAMPATADKLPATPVVPQKDGLFYALGVDPSNSQLYISDAVDFVQPGKVYVYSPKGQPTDTLTAGIIPGDFCFVK